MSAQRDTIVINGKMYNATSGLPVHEPTLIKPTQSHHKLTHVDGIIHHKKTAHKTTGVHTPKPKPHVSRSSSVSSSAVHNKTERSKTLMRQILKKPLVEPGSKQVSLSKPSKQPEHIVMRAKKNAAREARAAATPQHAKVHKFKSHSGDSVVTRVEEIAVKPVPQSEVSSNSPATQNIDTPPPLTTRSSRQPQQRNSFESVLRNAPAPTPASIGGRSHHKKRKGRARGVFAAIGIVFILGGFFTYYSLPSIRMQIASRNVGFTAAIPRYQPTGFGLNTSIQYQPGRVILRYASATDKNSGYTITQEKTALDSASMVNSYLGKTKDQAVEQSSNGRTVYIYNGTNATWVDGGIWYNIQGNAQLSPDQLLRIASSM